jgi:organic hydroperoxide reductase OsmC/OhrA
MNEEMKPYDVTIVWTGGKSGEARVEGMPKIRTGKPPDKEHAYHTPEHLLVAAAGTCLMNSFIEFTKKMHIQFESFEVEATGLLEKVGRSFEITRLNMVTRVGIPSADLRDRFERALELGAKYCYVANSLKAKTTYDHHIIVKEEQAE